MDIKNLRLYALGFVLSKGEKTLDQSRRRLHSFQGYFKIQNTTDELMFLAPSVASTIPRVFLSKHLLRYWSILARSSTLHFAGAVNTRQKITVHIINLVYSEFPNRSCRSVRSFISTLNCT